jgi:hypothetical protein
MKSFIKLLIIISISNNCFSQQLNYPSNITSYHGELLLINKEAFGLKSNIKSITAFNGSGKIKYYELKFDDNGNLTNKTVYNNTRKNNVDYSVVLMHSNNSIECSYTSRYGKIFKKITNKYDKSQNLIESELILPNKTNLTYDTDVKTLYKYKKNHLDEKLLYKKNGNQNAYKLISHTFFSEIDSLNYRVEKQNVIEYGTVIHDISNEYSEEKTIEKDTKNNVVSVKLKDRNGSLKTTLFEYNGYGRVIKEKKGFSIESLFKYDEKQRLIEKTLPEFNSSLLYIYNEKGEKVIVKQLNRNEKIQFEQRIEYDEQGNWQEFTFFHNGNFSGTTLFLLEYFD